MTWPALMSPASRAPMMWAVVATANHFVLEVVAGLVLALIGHAVALRGSARKRAGGLDAASYGSWHAALVDLSLRLSGLGWRNALCETAYVARGGEGLPFDGDMDALGARWPAWHARLANFLMGDPMRALREDLQVALATIGPPAPQRELFQ